MSGGPLLSRRDLYKMHGRPEPNRRANITIKATSEHDRAVGSGASGGGRTTRNVLVRDVMKKHGLSLPAASKNVKEHNVY